MNGSGNGFAIELGGQLRIPLGSHFGFFVESVYSLQRARKISGNYEYSHRQENANAAPYEISYSYEGTWRTVSAFWPTITDPNNIANTDPFKLNLSGFQVRAGLSWQF